MLFAVYWRTFGRNALKKICFCIEPYSRSALNELHSLTKKKCTNKMCFFAFFSLLCLLREREKCVFAFLTAHYSYNMLLWGSFCLLRHSFKIPVSDAKFSSLYRFPLIFEGITPQTYLNAKSKFTRVHTWRLGFPKVPCE